MLTSVGHSTCVISIVRATTLYLVVDLNDASWFGTDGAIWSMVEVNLAILCSSLPTIRYFVAKLLPCLGLRTQGSKYLGAPYMGAQLSSKSHSKSHRMSQFVMRSRKSQAADDANFKGSNKTIGGSSDGPTMPEPSAKSMDIMDTRWGIDHDKPGLYYHSNHISAWVSASPGESSPTRSKRASEDAESARQLVEHRVSDRDLGQQIMITTTIVQEGRAEHSSEPTSPGAAL